MRSILKSHVLRVVSWDIVNRYPARIQHCFVEAVLVVSVVWTIKGGSSGVVMMACSGISLITGIRPTVIRTSKSVSSLRLTEGQIVGCIVRLLGTKANSLIEELLKIGSWQVSIDPMDIDLGGTFTFRLSSPLDTFSLLSHDFGISSSKDLGNRSIIFEICSYGDQVYLSLLEGLRFPISFTSVDNPYKKRTFFLLS